MTQPLEFERALAELEAVVEQLQKPDVPLEQAVALFRRGTELAQQSEELLRGAELQVQRLTQAVQERFAVYEVEDDEEESLPDEAEST